MNQRIADLREAAVELRDLAEDSHGNGCSPGQCMCDADQADHITRLYELAAACTASSDAIQRKLDRISDGAVHPIGVPTIEDHPISSEDWPRGVSVPA